MIWGPYYWYPAWGWYFTTVTAGATLAFVASLPDDNTCEEVLFEGETLYLCDGTLYRPVYEKNELVYEVVSEPEASGQQAPVDDGQSEAPAETGPDTGPDAGSQDSDIRIDEDGFRWSD
ncbi:MAG: hypothetical protein AAF317_04440 [Pseudomonadota bacterium]